MSAIHDLNDSADKLHDAMCFLDLLYRAALQEKDTAPLPRGAAHAMDLLNDALHHLDAGPEKIRAADPECSTEVP
ncbi:hypothetical protein [Paracoccus rhizosphaerae]|uniref:Uncharacterized protein n=1 Tax=Paracoccus rhizosphaerae TaxID=1133347 RepID=A0ABV6CLD3_9RHOB|nr:hypothetical protein [Paracoccus rhizosphaerae]